MCAPRRSPPPPNCCRPRPTHSTSSMAKWCARIAAPVLRSAWARSRNILPPAPRHWRGREPGLAAEGWFRTSHQVYPYGNHVAVVRVDGETGGVTVERYFIAYDIGRAINPALVEAQIVGGFAQGLGGALFEEFIYSERGDPLAVTFADYLMPAIHETPTPEILLARGLHHAAQPARHQRRRRKRHHRRRRRDRVRHRRRHRHSGRRDAAPGDAAAAQAAFEQTRRSLTISYCSTGTRQSTPP